MKDLGAYLRPVPLAGETLRFDLSAFRSTVTREMLQVRVRMTAQAFGTAGEPVAANLTEDGTALLVDAGGLDAANAGARARLEAGPQAGVRYARALGEATASVDRVARGVSARLRKGTLPSQAAVLGYVEAVARHQALGALKFCLPESLPGTLAAWMGEPALVDALLAPEAPSLWSVLRSRELALARARLHGRGPRYLAGLARHRRQFGYLYAEDVDFRDHETVEAIDVRIAALGSRGPAGLAGERRRLAQARSGDRAAKAHARERFSERVVAAAGEHGDGQATFVSHVVLARALTAHEDHNRRAKMRFLRDLRDLADLTGLDLERAGLPEFAAAESFRGRPAVLRSR